MLPPSAPSWMDQVTSVDWPESAPVTTAAEAGTPSGDDRRRQRRDRDRDRRRGVTSTVAAAFLEGSATLVATTWAVTGLAGAV